MGKFRQYLEDTRQEGESLYARMDRFAEQIGVSSFCVRKWVYRQRTISDAMKGKVVAATKGRVTLEDLYKSNIHVQKAG